MNTITKKTAFITGGAGRLGSEFGRVLGKDGWRIILADINLEAAKETAKKLSSEGLKILAAEVDITNKQSLQNLLKNGPIDLLINNAYPRNINFNRPFFDVEYSDLCENLNTHLGGYFLTSQVFSEHFIKLGHGNIINISSIYGVIAPRFKIYEGTQMQLGPEYPLIKSSIIHMTKYLAQLLKGHNIRVNCVSPGGILDGQPDAFLQSYASFCNTKGMLNAKDVAGTIRFLASDDSSFLTGQNLVIDDGFTL